MKKDRLTYKTLARYMAKECSKQEKKRVDEWARKNSANAQKLEEFRHIWNSSKENTPNSRMFNEKEGWEQLNRRLRQEEMIESAREKQNFKKLNTVRRSLHSTTHQLMRFAAIFLITGLTGFFAYQNFYQPEPEAKEPALREISTGKAQRVNLTLADDTKVLLNAESSIKLPVHFKPDIREVFLEGQAFFNVAPNPDKPFIIHTAGSVIRVLGTSFSIRSYPGDGQVLVAVKEGRVSFETEGDEAFQETILTKGELGRYNLKTNEIESEQPQNISRFLSWIDGYLRFDNIAMSDIADELERRYNVKVNFENDEIKNLKLTAYLKSRSIKNVLNVITRSLNINYSLDDDRVTFFKKDK
ncbi:MAG TPA: FecR domain-containing protein [Balneolaceae bacterium]